VIEKITNNRGAWVARGELPSPQCLRASMKGVFALLLLAGNMLFSACGGGGGSSGNATSDLTLSGNWQFTMSPQLDGSNQVAFLGGLQGGFLVQSAGAVKGATTYAVSLPELPYPCNAGSATVTGPLSGQTVNLTAVAGTQTFTLNGTLDFDNSTMGGTYVTTAGTAPDGSACGIAQTTGLQWSAVLVPSVTGTIEGSFHSTGGSAGLANHDFPMSGSLTQGDNTGVASATVTGSLSFLNAATDASDYPCLESASIYGEISGNSVELQIVSADGSTLGQIGEPAGSNGVTGVNPVSLESASGGYILRAPVGPSYLVSTTPCPGSTNSTLTAGDYGDICIAVGITLGGANPCQEPILLTPASLTFPVQTVGTTSTQMITLSNTSGTALSGVALTLANIPASAANFAESDTCGANGVSSQGGPFSLGVGQSCAITISFTPGCAATQCASPLNASLTVTSPVSVDGDTAFTVAITGTGVSSGAVSASDRSSQNVEYHAGIY